MRQGTAEGNFEVEFDGIPSFRATKKTGGGTKNDPIKIAVGNDPFGHNVAGNADPDDMSFTIAEGMYPEAIEALEIWTENYTNRLDVTPRSGRMIVYDQSGETPLSTRALIDCVPLSCTPDDSSARGTGAATVTFTVRPHQVRRI